VGFLLRPWPPSCLCASHPRVRLPCVQHSAYTAVMPSILLKRLLLPLAVLYALAILVATVRAHNILAYWPHGVLLAVCWVIVPQMLQAWDPCRPRKKG